METTNKSVDEIIYEVLEESRHLESANDKGFVMFQEEANGNMIRQLYELRDRSPIFDLALRSLAEHMFVLHRLHEEVSQIAEVLENNSLTYKGAFVQIGEDFK